MGEMKPKLSIGVCVLISLALVLLGLGYGTYSGFADDRKQAVELLEGENGLAGVMSYRGSDGLNLCVVAERHLAGDSDVAALHALSQKLSDGQGNMAEIAARSKELDALVSAVRQKLVDKDSFRQSERDQRYLAMLESDLNSLAQSDLANTYNKAAEKFNQRLNDTLMGKLARLLGVTPCELYE